MNTDKILTMSVKETLLKKPDRRFAFVIGIAIVVIALVIMVCTFFENADLLLYVGLFTAFLITSFSLVVTRNFIAPLSIILGYNAVVMIGHSTIQPIDYSDVLTTFATAFIEISIMIGVLIMITGKLEHGLRFKTDYTLLTISIILSAGILTVASMVTSL